jgi:anti-sigma regulatory factor (Ser/Thr protein kinase)
VTDRRFELDLPPRSELLGTARSFAAAVARHYELGGEAIEDLKVAISEACVDALLVGERVRVLASEREHAVSFSVDLPRENAGPTAEQARDELGSPARFELIRSLFPDATLETDEGGRRLVRFSLGTA